MGGLAFLLLIPLSALWSMGVQDFHERCFQGVAVRTIMLGGFRIMIDQYKTDIQYLPFPLSAFVGFASLVAGASRAPRRHTSLSSKAAKRAEL